MPIKIIPPGGLPGVIIGAGNQWPPLPPVVITPIGLPFVTKAIQQIIGFAPLYPCTVDDCRNYYEDRRLLAFGQITSGVPETTPSYKNDFIPIYVDVSLFKANTSVKIDFLLQQLNLNTNTWSTLATISSMGNTYGINYPLGTWSNHPTYAGFQLNSAIVLNTHGPGVYRIKVQSTFKGASLCGQTDCYHIRAFDCDDAHGTVKMEAWLTGLVGDPYVDHYLHDLCGITLYDSFRYDGFFGKRQTPEYRKVNLKWGNPKHGLIEQVRNEAVPKFEYQTNYIHQVFHDRFSVFGMMADELRVSDYNINNSDRTIKRMRITPVDDYQPQYEDERWVPLSKVTTHFNKGVQSIIKSSCCPTVRPGASRYSSNRAGSFNSDFSDDFDN